MWSGLILLRRVLGVALLRPAGLAVGLGVLTAVGLPACAQSRVAHIYGPVGEIAPEDYGAVLDAYTRSYKLYDRLDDILFVTATYHAPEFRKAFAVSFPEIYGHGGRVTRKELLELTGNVERYHTFFMVAYTPKRDWNDFDQADSIWNVTLVGPHTTVPAAEITEVKVDENIHVVYPYVNRFDKAYLVRFPLTDAEGRLVIDNETRAFTLRLASALGAAEPTWTVKPGPPGSGPEPSGEPMEGEAGDQAEGADGQGGSVQGGGTDDQDVGGTGHRE